MCSSDLTYFVILYHSPISMALERGLSRFYFGRGMYQIKRRRGCRLMDSWTYAKVSDVRWIVSAAWFALATQWNRYKLRAARAAPSAIRLRDETLED